MRDLDPKAITYERWKGLEKVLRSACEVAWQAEVLACADFYSKHAADRKQHAEDGLCPWRGLISPPKRRLIADLEAMGAYDPRQESMLAQRMEAIEAERKWANA